VTCTGRYWAETFAHYLHQRDTLRTAGESGIAATTPTDPRPVTGVQSL
jgi:hypothetical protein